MSSIPTGAAVIKFDVDRSSVDAFLAEIRKGFTTSVRADFQGPGGATGGGSLGVASASGPATFANPNGRASFTGPSGNMAATGAGWASAGYGGAAMGGGGQQFNQAANQLTQAAQQLTVAAQRLGAGGGAPAVGGGGGGGTGGSSNRFFGISTSGLARYVGAGFLAHEALSVAQSYRQYNVESSLANGQPAGLAQAELGLYDRFSRVPILGQAADLFVDPTGSIRTGIGRTINEAGMRDEIGQNSYAMGMRSIAMQGQASYAGTRGFARSRAEAAFGHQQAMFGIAASEREQSTRLAQLGLSERQGIQDSYNADIASGVDEDEAGATAGRLFGTQGRNQRDRLAKLRASMAPMEAAQGAIYAGQRKEIDRQEALARRELGYRTESGRAAGQGRFGAAGEAEFYNRGSLEIAAADPELKDATTSAVTADRQAHQAQIDASIRLRNSGTAATRQLIERNGLGAQITQITGQAEYDVARAPTAADAASIRARAGAQTQRVTQEFGDRADFMSARLAAGNESMRIAISTHPEKPALGAALGGVNSIYRSAVLGAFATSRDEGISNTYDKAGKEKALAELEQWKNEQVNPQLAPGQKPKEWSVIQRQYAEMRQGIDKQFPGGRRDQIERQQLDSGILGLREFRQNFRRGLSTESLDSINQQATSGPGTTSPAELNASIDKMISELQGMRKDLTKIAGNVEGLISGDQ